MPGMSSGYLPPVVIRIIADNSRFTETIKKDMATLAAFGKQEANPTVGIDDKRFLTDLGAAKADLLNFAKEVYDARLGADAAPLVAEIAKMRAELRTLSPFDIKIDANIAAAEAKIAVLREQLAGLKTDSLVGSMLGGMTGAEQLALNRRVTSMWPVPVSTGSKSGMPGWLGSLLGAKAGMDKNGNPLGLAAALGFGTGKGILGALPVMGSLGSLFGFGAEHLAASGIGVGLSGLEAGLGGGLLGLGSMGVMGVGMGTNMAGIGQASNDIKQVVQAQNALNQAIAVYGKNSIQAVTAQRQLNYTLSSFSPIARNAVLAAANTAQGFETMFDKVTGLAEKRGAQIIQQAMKVGEKFLPIIGQYAAKNMAIIEKALNVPFNAKTGAGGLFSWLKSGTKYGGLGIFKDLESIFSKNLPTGMHALTQGIELFAKVVRDAAQYVGPFLQAINRLLTRLNSPGHAAALAHTIGKLIGIFRVWMKFILSIIRVLWDLGKATAGVGTGIIGVFTNILNAVAKFLGAMSNHKAIHGFFSAHYAQMVKGFGGILEGVVPVALAFAKAMMQIMAVTTRLTAAALAPIGNLLKLIFGGGAKSGHSNMAATVAGWVGALLVLRSALGRLLPQVTLLPTRIGVAWLKIKAFPGQVVGKVQAFWGALKAFPSNVVSFVQSLGSKIATLATRFGSFVARVATGVARFAVSVGKFIAAGAKMVAQYAVQVAKLIARAAVWIAEHAVMAATYIAQNVAMAASATAAFIAENAATLGLVAGIALLVTAIVYAATHWKQVWGLIKKVALDVWHALEAAWQWFWKQLGVNSNTAMMGIEADLRAGWDIIKAVATTVWHLIAAVVRIAWVLIRGVVKTGIDAISTVIAVVMDLIHGHWSAAWHALWAGLQKVAGDIWSTVKGMMGKLVQTILAGVANFPNLLFEAGVHLVEGLIRGIGSMLGQAASAIGHLGSSIVSGIKGILGIKSPSVVFRQLGIYTVQGFVQGIDTQRGAALQSVQALAKGVVDAGRVGLARPLSGGLVAPAAAGGVGSFNNTTHITVNAASGNAQEILRVLQPALEQHDKQLIQRLRAGQAYR